MAFDRIEKVSKVGEKLKKIVDKQVAGLDPVDRQRFQDVMRQEEAKQALSTEVAQRTDVKRSPFLMEEVRKVNGDGIDTNRPSRRKILAQTEDAIKKIDVVKEKLSIPDLELKTSVRNLMKKKLNHIDKNLKTAMDRAGADYQSPDEALAAQDIKDLSYPIRRFLGFLTHGQDQLHNLGSTLSKVNQDELSPGSLLAVQIKVGKIQHEVEFFTSLLNKALESTKTIMNVQV